MPRVRVLYFASVRDAIGLEHEEVDLPDRVEASELIAALARRHPRAAVLLGASRLAVDQEFARGPVLLTASAEVAVIPPVSGG
jgi:molybdopterin converting factor subunit 1